VLDEVIDGSERSSRAGDDAMDIVNLKISKSAAHQGALMAGLCVASGTPMDD